MLQVGFAPVKMFPRLLLDDEASQQEDGIREVVKMIKKAKELNPSLPAPVTSATSSLARKVLDLRQPQSQQKGFLLALASKPLEGVIPQSKVHIVLVHPHR